jgi:hypothetical protein
MPRTPPPAGMTPSPIRLFDYLRQQDLGIPDMPVIVADEIARQIDALPSTGGASPPASSYGIVVPPFPKCFIEADVMLPDLGLAQRGVWIVDLTREWRAGEISLTIRQHAPAGTSWLFSATGYLRGAATRGVVYGYAGTMLFHLDMDGRLLDDTERVQVVSIPNQQPSPYLLPGDGLPNHAPYMLKAISAMHERCAADKVTPPRQARRQAERAGVKQLHEYYVLRVQPRLMPRDMAEVGQPSKAQGQRREHMVRGHFRYYPPERPLFGHTSGMIWIPAHERGESDIGRIKKDYEVGNGE